MQRIDYAYRRALRFKLSPVENALSQDIPNLTSEQDTDKSVQQRQQLGEQLLIQMQQIKLDVENYVYISEHKKRQQTRLNSTLEIKQQWLKQYTKSLYMQENWNNQDRKPKIKQISYLPQVFSDWFAQWSNLIEQLNDLNARPEHNLARDTEYASVIQSLRQRQTVTLMREFVNHSNPINEADKRELAEQFTALEKVITDNEQYYLSSQTAGICIARASLNYFTLNKKPIDFEAKREELEKQLTAKANTNGLNLPEYKIAKEDDTLDNAYSVLKAYLAEKKANFSEAMQQGLSFQELKNQHPLFDCKESHFNAYLTQTNRIAEIGEEINRIKRSNSIDHNKLKQLKNESTKLKQERGRFFLQTINSYPPKESSTWHSALKDAKLKYDKIEGEKVGASNYKKACRKFREIAMKRGKVIAQLRGIEKEKIESQLLNYWALFAIDKNQYQLILIPKNKAKSTFNYLDYSNSVEPESQQHSENGIYVFKSLTLRALDKLCFTADSSFQQSLIESGIAVMKDIKGRFDLSGADNEKALIKFYKEVLNSQYLQDQGLDLQDFSGIETLLKSKHDSLKDFEKDMERNCYVARQLDLNLLGTLKDKYQAQVLELDNADFQSRASNKTKAHTQVWQQLWQIENREKDYPIRLNPELRIHWRQAKASRLQKYGPQSTNHDPQKRNRFLQPQLTLVSTITERANGERSDIAFSKFDELTNNILKFNQRFYDKNIEGKENELYYFGIDRGQAELATCSLLTKFSKTNKPTFARFEVYKIKTNKLNYSEAYMTREGEKQRYLIDNPSYFIGRSEQLDKQLFEIEMKNSIDLTIAKVIKGRIVENGDVKSYLRLKQLNAKRRLYLQHAKRNLVDDGNELISYDEKEKAFKVRQINSDEFKPHIYYFREDLAQHISKPEVESELKAFAAELKQQNQYKDNLTIEKINHLRDAMSANMVGVLYHLFQKFNGILVLEDLFDGVLAKHFTENFENISRRLEWSLYRKFQKDGLVPPQLKDSILLRSEGKKIKQFGAIIFINEENTSTQCPACGKSHEDKTKFAQDKFQNRKFLCTHCGFEASPERQDMGLQSPDDVACYNIAKKGYKLCEKAPQSANTNAEKNNYGKAKNRTSGKPTPKHRPNNKYQAKPATHKGLAGLGDMLKKK